MFCGGKDLRCGMGEHPYHMWHVAHLYHIVGLSMLDAEDHNTCKSVTDHHEYHKLKCNACRTGPSKATAFNITRVCWSRSATPYKE